MFYGMDVPFSYFIDFLLAAGTSRVVEASKQARQARGIPFDLYRPWKDLAVEVAAGQQDGAAFDRMLGGLTDPKALKHYPALVAGYRKFLRRMARLGATWWASPKPVTLMLPFGYGVSVNPELGFTVAGAPTLIKLYCRMEPLERPRVEMMCGVLASALGPSHPGAKFAVLAVREGKLHAASDAVLARAIKAARIDGPTYAEHRR